MLIYVFTLLFRNENKIGYLRKNNLIRNKQKFEPIPPFIHLQTNSRILLHLNSYNLNYL
jgi:ribosomal protein L39E